MHDAIIVENLGKKFRRYQTTQANTFKGALAERGWRKREEPFWALRNVTFRIAAGKALGIIGRNGMGKSTLLRLLGGVGKPDEGKIELSSSRIGALLDLGFGFHPDMTGRESVFFTGVISGQTRQEVGRQFEAIVEFADIGEFIDAPTRTYSSGMKMRLAFAVAVHIDPDILLIDEILSVGDNSFRGKCLERIHKFKAQGVTIVIVSHSMDPILYLCDEAILLDKGRVVAHGDPNSVVEQYAAMEPKETQLRTPVAAAGTINSSGIELQPNINRFGTFEMEVRSVRVLDRQGNPINEIQSGDGLRFEIVYEAHQQIEAPIFCVIITHENGTVYHCTRTAGAGAGLDLSKVEGRGQITLEYDRLEFAQGLYYLDVSIYEKGWGYKYDFHVHAYSFRIHASSEELGIIRPPHRWAMSNR